MKKLRDYQEECIKKLDEKYKKTDKVVLSICPSGGKTTTAIQYANRNKYKTMVLAHGTSVLRSQWGDALNEHNLEWSEDFSKNFIVNLPQSLYRKKKFPKIDLLIIDEAHEFYFASMVKTIIKKVKPRKVLLLTGTPSKFIKEGYETIIVSADTLIEQNYINNVYFGLASTNENLKKTDYNKDGDVKEKVKFKDTNNTLDKLMSAIHNRLKETNTKGKPYANKLNPIKLFNKLNKTMIACNNIAQANEVGKYFDQKGIKIVVSHNNNDPDSSNIQVFLEDNSVKVLVVVNRGILGFNMPEMVNIVDMTCSKNIDRIYQLYARVMRTHSKYKMKYFFKVVPENNADLYKFYMSAALCLLREDFISKYNGKNLNGMEIPILKPKKKRGNSKGKQTKSKVTKPEKYVPIDELFQGTVEASQLLIDIYNKQGKKYNEYAYTTIGKLQERNFGIKRKITNVSEEVVKWLAQADVNDVMPEKLEESMYV